MTAIKSIHSDSILNDLRNGVSLIKSVYAVIYTADRSDGPAMLVTLKAGTTLLRNVHFQLCNMIIDEDEGLIFTKANVKGLPKQINGVLEQLDIAAISVHAAIVSPFLRVMDEVRQEAAVEQVRSAAIILKNAIEHVETPTV